MCRGEGGMLVVEVCVSKYVGVLMMFEGGSLGVCVWWGVVRWDGGGCVFGV